MLSASRVQPDHLLRHLAAERARLPRAVARAPLAQAEVAARHEQVRAWPLHAHDAQTLVGRAYLDVVLSWLGMLQN